MKTVSLAGAAVALALGLSACAVMRPSFELQPCKLEGIAGPLLCGSLPVPEDRGDPDSRRIALKIVVVPSSGERKLPPLYDLAGGPGLAATEDARFWATDGSIHRAQRDIVLVDQRGTGGSATLDCPVSFYDPFAAILPLHTVADCRADLASRADLAQYTTAASVEDLDDVRAALGHDRIDLVGLSYGTRIAQEYLRAHPDRVRAMALLGTVSPTEKLPMSFSPNAQAVLDRLSAQCAADKACRASIESVSADAVALRNALALSPVQVTRKDGRKVAIEPGAFWEAVRRQLTTTTSQRRLPWLLHQAAHGDHKPLIDVMSKEPEPGSDGLLLAVSCAEDTLRINAEEIALASATVFGSYRVQRQIAACKVWRGPVLANPRPGFVTGNTPVLLMAGDMDHVTPVDWAHKVASHLPNSRVVVIPDLGHFPAGLTNMECYDKLISDFFIAGSARDLDTACVATMKPPAFDVPKLKKEAPPAKKAATGKGARKKAVKKKGTKKKSAAKAKGKKAPKKKAKPQAR